MPSQRSWQERTISPTRPSRPPTRSSMNCPSIVWVFMTSNSASVRAAGLCRISLGIEILPTSCSSAANSSSWRCRRRSELVGHGVDQIDDRAAVLRGVRVVELDHVREEHDRAPIGAVQLERRRVALPAVAREDVEQPDERGEHEQTAERLVEGHERRPERRSGRGSRRHALAPTKLSRVSRTGPVISLLRSTDQRSRRRPGPRTRGRRPARWSVGLPGASAARTSTGPIAEPGVRDRREPAVPVPACPRRGPGPDARSPRRGDQQRHVRSAAQQQHRHEDELLRDHIAVAELEAHPRYQRVAHDQAATARGRPSRSEGRTTR